MGNKYDLDKYSQTVKGGKTKLSPEDEKYFQEWYQVWSNVSGISNNPDDPLHYYDYRGAYEAGAELDKDKHYRQSWDGAKVEGIVTRTVYFGPLLDPESFPNYKIHGE